MKDKFKEIWEFIKKHLWLRIPVTILIFVLSPLFIIIIPFLFICMKIDEIYCEIWEL
jgi:hypothetical protein